MVGIEPTARLLCSSAYGAPVRPEGEENLPPDAPQLERGRHDGVVPDGPTITDDERTTQRLNPGGFPLNPLDGVVGVVVRALGRHLSLVCVGGMGGAVRYEI